jgi:serine/threonine protein kinase
MPPKPTVYSGPVWSAGTLVQDLDARVVGVLGRGGMAIVYEVERLGTGQRYALKVLSPHLTDRSDVIARFLREADALRALLTAPNIVRLYDAGHLSNNQPYLLLERLYGRTLRQVLAAGRLPFALGCRYVHQLLWSLAVVHHAGLVHRDVKPENFFIQDDGTCKLLDFGLVKVVIESPVPPGFETGPGAVFGTSAYMAPEHASGKVPDARADVFAVGVVLTEVLLGARALRGMSDDELQARIMKRGFPSIEELGGFDVPLPLRAIVARATAFDPADRYPTVVAFAADLARAARFLNLLSEAWLTHAPAGLLVPPPRASAPPPAAPPAAASPHPSLPSLVPVSQRHTRKLDHGPAAPLPASPSPPPAPAAVESHPPLHAARTSPRPWRSSTPPSRSLFRAFVPRFEDFVARMAGRLTPVRQARRAEGAKLYRLEARKVRQVGEAPPSSQRPVWSPVTPPSGLARVPALATAAGLLGLAALAVSLLHVQEGRVRGAPARQTAELPGVDPVPLGLSGPTSIDVGSPPAPAASPSASAPAARPTSAPGRAAAASASPAGSPTINDRTKPVATTPHPGDGHAAASAARPAASAPGAVFGPKRRLSLPRLPQSELRRGSSWPSPPSGDGGSFVAPPRRPDEVRTTSMGRNAARTTSRAPSSASAIARSCNVYARTAACISRSGSSTRNVGVASGNASVMPRATPYSRWACSSSSTKRAPTSARSSRPSSP